MTERELLDALARDVAEALTAIADREGCWAGVTRSFASSIYARHARPVEEPTSRADADDAGARLVAMLGEVELDRRALGQALDLAREVVRQRDEARRKCEDAMADALHAHTARVAAERERDEARREAARWQNIAEHNGNAHDEERARAELQKKRDTELLIEADALTHALAALDAVARVRALGLLLYAERVRRIADEYAGVLSTGAVVTLHHVATRIADIGRALDR